MVDPTGFRDSTQIVLPVDSLERLHTDLEAKFTVTVRTDDSTARIIGSPVVIKEVSDFLIRHGISLR